MFALFSRILKLAGQYKGRIQGAFVCAFVESILSKMPIFLAFCGVERICRRNTDWADLPLCWTWPCRSRAGSNAGPLSQ